MLNEQKQKIAMAIRKTEAQKKSGVYFCGGSFFQKMDSGDCINEMKDSRFPTSLVLQVVIKKIDTNISENREERDVLIRKLHQLGIYGI